MHAPESIQELLGYGPDCLTPEQLASLDAEPAGAERARLEAHLAACSRCSAERALIASFESASETAGERRPLAAITAELERKRAAQWPVAAPARKAWFRLGWFSPRLTPGTASRFQERESAAVPSSGFFAMRTWSLAAASLLVVVAGGLYLRSLREPGLPSGSGADWQTVRSVRVQAIAPSGAVGRVPVEFQWKTTGSAERYRVTVRDVEGATLWSAETAAPPLAAPKELQVQLLPGKTVTWEVEALANGKRLASSGPVRFVFRPEP